MPGWVGVDAEAWLGATQARGTQRQHPGLGLGDVADLEVQVGLRRKRRVRRARGLVTRDTLEAQAAAVGITDLCPAFLGPGDGQAKQLRVKLRQDKRVRAVQDHREQLADHRPSIPAMAGPG